MFRCTKNDVVTLAKANDFVVNTTEKVLRLCDFLTFVSAQGEKLPLILKGGTAINFCLLNLPRLSVDADFDFALNLPKEEVTKEAKSKIGYKITCGPRDAS